MLWCTKETTSRPRQRLGWGLACCILSLLPGLSRAAPVPKSTEFPPPVISLAVSDDFKNYTVYIYNGGKVVLCLPFGNYDPFLLSLTYTDGKREENTVWRNMHPTWEERENWKACPDAVLPGQSIEREYPLKIIFTKIDRRPFVLCTTFRSGLASKASPQFNSKACSHVQPLANGTLKVTPRVTQTQLEPNFW